MKEKNEKRREKEEMQGHTKGRKEGRVAWVREEGNPDLLTRAYSVTSHVPLMLLSSSVRRDLTAVIAAVMRFGCEKNLGFSIIHVQYM